MCIAILNIGDRLGKKTLRRCWNNNPDGGGIAWVEDSKLKIFKELKDFSTFYDKYKELKDTNKVTNMLLHFRIRTHGKVNESNCHPFKVNDNIAFIHNGVISGTGLSKCDDFSDTYLFNQLFLQKMPKDFLHNEAILNLISEYIGYSKIILLDNKNHWVIINENLGHWSGKNWFSNESYKQQSYLSYKPFQSTGIAFTSVKKVDNNKGKILENDTYDDYEWGGKYSSYKTKDACGCCGTYAELSYITEWNMDMCKTCIEDYCDISKY